MATGSQAAARDRLRVALYRTGRPQYDSRCDTCAHCVPAQRGSRYDRTCSLHDAPVSASGVCQAWTPRAVGDVR